MLVFLGTGTSRKWLWSGTGKLCCSLLPSTVSGTSRPWFTEWERDVCLTNWWRCCPAQEVTAQLTNIILKILFFILILPVVEHYPSAWICWSKHSCVSHVSTQGAWAAAVRRRARWEAGWIKLWSSRWRRPTAACQSVSQRSTLPCTPSIKTGCRARTPSRPAHSCTPSTEIRLRSTHSPHTCSGEENGGVVLLRHDGSWMGAASGWFWFCLDHLIAHAGTMKDKPRTKLHYGPVKSQ